MCTCISTEILNFFESKSKQLHKTSSILDLDILQGDSASQRLYENCFEVKIAHILCFHSQSVVLLRSLRATNKNARKPKLILTEAPLFENLKNLIFGHFSEM